MGRLRRFGPAGDLVGGFLSRAQPVYRYCLSDLSDDQGWYGAGAGLPFWLGDSADPAANGDQVGAAAPDRFAVLFFVFHAFVFVVLLDHRSGAEERIPGVGARFSVHADGV